jgi:hypothetical protein
MLRDEATDNYSQESVSCKWSLSVSKPGQFLDRSMHWLKPKEPLRERVLDTIHLEQMDPTCSSKDFTEANLSCYTRIGFSIEGVCKYL